MTLAQKVVRLLPEHWFWGEPLPATRSEVLDSINRAKENLAASILEDIGREGKPKLIETMRQRSDQLLSSDRNRYLDAELLRIGADEIEKHDR